MSSMRFLRLHNLPFFLFIITMIAVVIGGTIRIYDAGESCPDWPLCFGSFGFDISPEDQKEWYQSTGEYDSRGSDHTYTTWEIFVEWIHRFVTGLILGPLCIVQWFITFRRKNSIPSVHTASTVALILVIAQGILGYLTVKYDNINWSVAAHLIMAMLLSLSLLWAWIRWMDAESSLPKWMDIDYRIAIRYRPNLYNLTVSTMFVLILGAFVSSTPHQNGACGIGSFDAWPLCHGSLFGSFGNTKYLHRLVVVAVFIFLLWSVQNIEAGSLRKVLHCGIGFYVLNALVGGLYIITASSGFIEILSLLHLVFATASFLCIGFAALLTRNIILRVKVPQEE
ncbi:MAG: COX15/CtaA family protein [Candidatus Thermoplasmatota archaeon]|nr:COX15/CtaA family protein [Candidatus Thermoplasmatota archaeon]MEC9090287.1 COX15/CtaA family protein [Candidatus Thermoplasmatota archaeon]